jgi:hypothetical protein
MAAQRKTRVVRQDEPKAVSHQYRAWALAILGTLIGTAVIQGVRSWVDADAYDDEVRQIVEPVADTANQSLQSVQTLQVDLARLALEGQEANVEKEVYRLETEREADPAGWKPRDEERLRDMRERLGKVRRQLEKLDGNSAP